MTLSRKIAQSIADQIVEGQLKPGDRLYESKLTEMFGTSRVPIREALYILEKDEIVERIPRQGVFVKEYHRKDLRDLYEVAYRLEELALEEVIEHITEQQLTELYQLIEEMASCTKNREINIYFSLMEKLHLQFFKLSTNKVLADFYSKLTMQLKPFRYMSLSYPNSLEHSLKEYVEIVDGISMRDSNMIRDVLHKKKERALKALDKIIKDRE